MEALEKYNKALDELVKIPDKTSQAYKSKQQEVGKLGIIAKPELYCKKAPAPPKVTPPKVAPSTNPVVNFWTKQVQAKEQEHKESVASDKKYGKGMPSNKTALAGMELKTAKENLQKEISNPMVTNPC
jgi:hypothetical protein